MADRITELLPLLAHLQSPPGDDASLQALSERAGLSASHLQRVFSQSVGESPKRFTSRVALARAAAALLTGEATVLEVALESGFESHAGFTRAFRRHFGLSPTEYRRRGLAATGPSTPEIRAAHREVVERVAPCVGLYGRRLAPPHERREAMGYEITRKQLVETPILFQRKRITRDQIASALAELLPAVYSFAVRKGIALAGPPLCRYCDVSAGGMTLEAGMPVAAPVDGAGDVLAGTLPGGPAVSTVHHGPYDGLPHAHAAIESWLESHGIAANGDPWEVYVTDPGEVPDPAGWRTEVVRPIAD